MLYLILVSLIWAFSFGLIKGQLTGLDPNLVAAIRLFLAWLVFLPFCRLRHCRLITIICLLAIGAIQYGVMSIPTLVFFKDGKEVDRLIGLNTKEALLSKLEAIAG